MPNFFSKIKKQNIVMIKNRFFNEQGNRKAFSQKKLF